MGAKRRLPDSEVRPSWARKRRHEIGDHSLCLPGSCPEVGSAEQRAQAVEAHRQRVEASQTRRNRNRRQRRDEQAEQKPLTPIGEQLQLIRWLIQDHGGREMIRLPGRHPSSHSWQVPTARGRVSVVVYFGGTSGRNGKTRTSWVVTAYRCTRYGCRSYIGPRAETDGLAAAVEDRVLRALAPDGPATRLEVKVPLRVEIDSG